MSNETGQHILYLGSMSGHHSLYAFSNSEKSNNASVIVDRVRLDDVIDPATKIDLIKIGSLNN